MSSEELKPCPFCDGDVSFHKDEECPGCHLIQCGQCRAFFDFATGADPGNDCASVDALRAAIAPMWNARAQLAAIQQAKGEEPLVVATAILGGLFHGGSGPELGDIDVEVCTPHLEKIQCETVDSSDDVFMPLMTVSQHQRITAAMAAEVERLRDRNESLEQQAAHNYEVARLAAEQTSALRAELEVRTAQRDAARGKA